MASVRLDRLAPRHVAVLRAVLAAAGKDGGAMLVGGAVRDAVLARAHRVRARTVREIDVDVAVPRDALAIGQRAAESLGGTFVALDEERGAARVVAPGVRLDVMDFRAPTLEADLAGRDFTVNALAVPLDELLARGEARIVDATGGLDDLRARRLRPPDPRVLTEDPLRALRGVRLEAQLGLRLTPAAVRAIRAVAGDLPRVAPERIRDELVLLLKLPETARALRRLDAVGVLTVVVPEIEAMRRTPQPAPHRFSVLEHSFRAVAGADRLVAEIHRLDPFGEELRAHLSEPLGADLERRHLLKLAALLHDVSKPETRRLVRGRIRFFEHDTIGATRAREIGRRIRLPERATATLERLVRHHLRTMHLGQTPEITRRARDRFFRDLGEDARDLLLLTLVDAAAVTGESPFAAWRRSRLVRDLLAGWQEEQATIEAPPLLRGEDVMQRFALAPGPEVGRLLRHAREAQDLGLVRTRDEALAYLDSSPGGP